MSSIRQLTVSSSSADSGTVYRDPYRTAALQVPRFSRNLCRPALLAIVLLVNTLNANAAELAIGDKLPPLHGQYLNGRKATLPADASGHVALLLIGFTYQSRFPVEEWAKHFRAEFGTNPHVTFYEVPMIGGMARIGKWFIDSGMRRGTAPTDYEHVITVYGGTDPWKACLGIKDQDAANLVLLDQQGRIVWRHSGSFDSAAYQSLSAELKKLIP